MTRLPSLDLRAFRSRAFSSGQPLFALGFGQGFTTFEYSNLVTQPETLGVAGSATISLVVKNTGKVAGDEVARLYIRDVLASVARLSNEWVRMLDRDMQLLVAPGEFRIMVGSSSKDIRLRGELTVQ